MQKWIALAVLLASSALATDIQPQPSATLDQGFQLLYNLDFERAHEVFTEWEALHPDDPLGPASDAVGLLFSEFNRLGVLESQFLDDDKAFNARKKLDPIPAVRDRFRAALEKADQEAQLQLTKDPKNGNALFALTLSSGLQADYSALVEKRNLASLRFTKEANGWAERLLSVDPNCSDAYLATGFSKYIIGSMSAPVRWLVRLGGVAGDKEAGVAELKLTAAHGRYLAPFARILLAIAYVRENNKSEARALLASLRDQFPANRLFSTQIARLDAASGNRSQ